MGGIARPKGGGSQKFSDELTPSPVGQLRGQNSFDGWVLFLVGPGTIWPRGRPITRVFFWLFGD